MAEQAEQPKKPTGGAFGRFLHEQRSELMKECVGQRATAVVQLASARYKALGEAEKAEYQEKYSKAAEQYSKDLEAFLAGGGEKKASKKKDWNMGEENATKKRKKDPEAPKKPAGGAYGCFVAKHRAEFQEQTKGQSITAVAKLASEKWKALGEAEKKPFQEDFVTKTEAYKAAMKDYVPPEEPEPKVDEKAAAKEAAKEAATEAKETKKEAKEAAKEAATEAKETKKEAKEAKKKAMEDEKEAKGQAKKQTKEDTESTKEQTKEAKAQAKGDKNNAKQQAKEDKKSAKAKDKTPKAKAKILRASKASSESKVELQATVEAKAEKEGLKDKLIQLVNRQDIIDSKKSQPAILKALQDSGGLIHPAKRALLGA